MLGVVPERRRYPPQRVAQTDERAAAVATAGLASWVAHPAGRAPDRETVLVVGATGAAGGMALRTARHLGAGNVIAVGRDEARLERLDADVAVALDGMLRSTGLELIGSGIGSVAVMELLAGAGAGELLAAAPAAGFDPPYTSLPLPAVAEAWHGDPGVRHILTPAW